MQDGFARRFYDSRAWKTCRQSYANYRKNLCERCMAKGLIVPGEEVHHIIKLTPENIDNPLITLSWNNLELLCKDCHLEKHRKAQTRWQADEEGRIRLPPVEK